MTQTSPPATAFAETPRTRAEFYRRLCALPAVVDPTTGRITMEAGLVKAIMMPTELAQRVRTSLDVRGVSPLSIIGHPRSNMWTFLVRSDIRPIGDPEVVAQLWRARVVVIREGDIALPSPATDPDLIRTWVSPATGVFRPSGAVVIQCVLACLSGQARR